MEFINYFLAVLVSYLGLFTGMFLAKNSPEEMEPGKKYFVVIEKILFFVMMLIAIVFFVLYNNYVLLGVSLLYTFTLFINHKHLYFTNYIYLAIVMPFFEQLTILMLSLVFIYGLPVGTLDTKDLSVKESIVKILKKYVLFAVIASAGYFL